MNVVDSTVERTSGSIEYEVDPDGAIVSVNDSFIGFAGDNGWTIEPADVIGTSLLDHVSGDRVRELHRTLLAAVRTGNRPLTLPMRCDSPTERRWLSVSFTPLGDGRIGFASKIERVETRPYQPLLDVTLERSDTAGLLTVCAWCARVRYGGAWVDIDDVAERLGIADAVDVPGLSHGICDRCEDALSGG